MAKGHELKPAEETIEGVKKSTRGKDGRRTTPKPPKKMIKSISPDEGLNDKHHMFIAEYLRTFNATKAYMKVYNAPYGTSMAEGSKLIGNPMIRKEVQKAKDKAFESSFIDLSVIISKYKDIAFADINDYVEYRIQEITARDGKGNIKLDDKGNPIIKYHEFLGLKEGYDGTIVNEITNGQAGLTVKLADRMEALKRLEKYYNHLSDDDKIKMELSKLQLEKAKLEVERARLELAALSGEGDVDNTHEKVAQYAAVLESTTDVFEGEVIESPTGVIEGAKTT